MPESIVREISQQAEWLHRGGGSPRDNSSPEAPTRQLAADTLNDLLAMDIPPTPDRYEVWYAHRSGQHTELSRRLRELQSEFPAITGAHLDALHHDHFGGSEAQLDTIGSATGEIEEATRVLLKHLSASQAPLLEYGASLASFSGLMQCPQSAAILTGPLSGLMDETARVTEHNRSLREQLEQSSRRITTLRNSLVTVRRAATTDSLTGLLNRRAFETRLRRAITRSRDEPFTLLLADIDHFKRFNDLHGHSTGDLVLRLVSRLLTQIVKGRDAVGRYGGEEFAMVLAGAEANGAASVAQQICDVISAKSLVEKGSSRSMGRVTLSIGVAQHQPAERMLALIDRADAALYAAKNQGRNRVVVSPRG